MGWYGMIWMGWDGEELIVFVCIWRFDDDDDCAREAHEAALIYANIYSVEGRGCSISSAIFIILLAEFWIFNFARFARTKCPISWLPPWASKLICNSLAIWQMKYLLPCYNVIHARRKRAKCLDLCATICIWEFIYPTLSQGSTLWICELSHVIISYFIQRSLGGRSSVNSVQTEDGQKLGGPINRTDSSRKVQSELE